MNWFISIVALVALGVIVAGCNEQKPENKTSAGTPATSPAANTQAGASSRCRIVFAPNGCSTLRDKSADAKGVIDNDSFKDADKLEAKCLARAKAFHEWCKATAPVTATFISGDKEIASETYPK